MIPSLRVLLVIGDFEFGGAQRQVVALANTLNETGHEAHVCSLSSYVPLADGLHNADRILHIIEKKRRFDFSVIWRLERLIRSLNTQVVHCFFFDAEVAGRLAGRLARVPAIVGSERCSVGRMSPLKRFGLKMTDGCIGAVIANSFAGKSRYMRDVGTASDRIHVVYNGVDTTCFRPVDRCSARAQLGIPPDAKVVGMVASYKAHKNHEMYVRAAEWVLERMPAARFLAVGDALLDGYDDSQRRYEAIQSLVDRLHLQERFLFLPNQKDMARLYSACDVTALTSLYEGTPNVLLESMSCGVPVVATDVSDNARIVKHGLTGFLVASNDVQDCGRRLLALLSDEDLRFRLGLQSRTDVQDRFSLQALGENTVGVYRYVLHEANQAHLSRKRTCLTHCASEGEAPQS